MAERKSEALKPVLEQVEKQLDERIAETCAADSAKDESTAELEKLSETLTLAAQSAHAAASLRRRIRETKLVEKLSELGVQLPPDVGNVPRRNGASRLR